MISRLLRLGPLLVLCATLLLPSLATALDRAVVGVLRFTSSGPVFLALERGHFRDAGFDVELAFFQDAASVATATASGEVTYGVTALTGAFYNLAAAGKVKMIAGQSQERRGHPGNLILVSRAEYANGRTELAQYFERPFGLTRLGSPSHYMLGQLAEAMQIAPERLQIRSFQTLPNLVAAFKTGAVSWAIIAPPISTMLIDSGAAVALAPFSDLGSYQFGAVFAASDLVEQHPDRVRAFLGAYRKGLEDYALIVAAPRTPEARAAAVAVGAAVYPDLAPEEAARQVVGSALYVDPTGRLDLADIERQIRWYDAQGMLKTVPELDAIVRQDLLP